MFSLLFRLGDFSCSVFQFSAYIPLPSVFCWWAFYFSYYIFSSKISICSFFISSVSFPRFAVSLLRLPIFSIYFKFLISFMLIDFWEREGGREGGGGGGAERGRQRIWNELCADSREPNAGLKLTNREIMTWADVGRPTNWATQVPFNFFLKHFYDGCNKIFVK